MPVNGAVLIFTSTNGHAQSQNGHGNHSLIPPFTHSLIGGGTDLLVQRLDELREQPVRLIFDQRGRRGIRQESAGCVMLSVATTTSHLLESDLLRGLLPHLPQYLKLVSSTNSQTPKEIAISIAAELIQVRHAGWGGVCTADSAGPYGIRFILVPRTRTRRAHGTLPAIPQRSVPLDSGRGRVPLANSSVNTR